MSKDPIQQIEDLLGIDADYQEYVKETLRVKTNGGPFSYEEWLDWHKHNKEQQLVFGRTDSVCKIKKQSKA